MDAGRGGEVDQTGEGVVNLVPSTRGPDLQCVHSVASSEQKLWVVMDEKGQGYDFHHYGTWSVHVMDLAHNYMVSRGHLALIYVPHSKKDKAERKNGEDSAALALIVEQDDLAL